MGQSDQGVKSGLLSAMNKIYFVAGCLLLVVSLLSCSQSSEQPATTTTTTTTSTSISTTTTSTTTSTTVLTATVSGLVTLEGYEDFSGVSITLEGLVLSAVTSTQGAFTINDVPQGIYNIFATKDGFDPSSKYLAVLGNSTTSFYLIPTTPPPAPF